LIRITRDSMAGKDGFFTRHLNEYLLQKSGFEMPRDRIIRPSEITECTRSIVLKLLGYGTPETITPRQQRIFDMGNYVHKRYLTSYIPHMGCAARVCITLPSGKVKTQDFIETTLQNKELWLKGTPDAVVISREDGLPYIFELKSIKQELFLKLEQPDWSYTAQVHCYMMLTGIPRSIVYYENKNDEDTKEFVILEDKYIHDTLITKIKEIQNYVLNYSTTQALPPLCNDKWCRCCKESA